MSSQEELRLDQVKERIRRLVTEVQNLSETACDPDEYFPQFLQRTVEASSARGGVVWLSGRDGQWVPRYPWRVEGLGLADDADVQQLHQKLLAQATRDGRPVVVAPAGPGGPGSDVSDTTHPGSSYLIFAPIVVESRTLGVVETVYDPGRDPDAYRGFAEFCQQMARYASGFLGRFQLRQTLEERELWSRIVGYVGAVHDSLDPVRVAMQVVNLGRDLVGADRLSVGVRRGRRVRILAVGGQDTVHQQTQLAKGLAALGRAVCDHGEAVDYHAESEPQAREQRPRALADAIGRFAEAAECRHARALPLEHNDETVGVLIAERMSDPALSESAMSRLDMVARQGAAALANARTYRAIPMLWLMRALAWVLGVRWVRAAVVLLVLGAVAGVLFGVRSTLWLDGDACVVPERVRTVYVQTEGVVSGVLADHGDRVTAGRVVLRMSNPELDLKCAETQSQLVQAEGMVKQLEAQLRENPHDPSVGGRLNQELARRDGLRRQRALYGVKLKTLTLTAPITGVVTTMNVRDRLADKPVKVGDALMEVADTDGPWVLDVRLPEHHMGGLVQARAAAKGETLAVRFFLASHPGRTFTGRVERVAPAAELIDDKNVVMVRVRPDRIDVPLKPNIEARAKIACGQHVLGYVWFREVIHFFQTRVLF